MIFNAVVIMPSPSEIFASVKHLVHYNVLQISKLCQKEKTVFNAIRTKYLGK